MMNKDEFTIQEFHIEVDDHHTLYVHEWGNPDGFPIVNLHGGPGGSSKDKYRSLFNPQLHRVIFFDQRGCGLSMPLGSREKNNTQDLIKDISKITNRLNLKTFGLHGGSWGSCLALAYATEHPERVSSLVITGVFTGTSEEINWISNGLFEHFYPDVWQRYLQATPKNHRSNPTGFHFKNILEEDHEAQKKSAYTFHNLEGGIVKLDDRFAPENYEDYDPAATAIEVHYLANNCFLPKQHILKNAHKLHMPVVIVQGRYDIVCPPKTAFELHNKLSNSALYTSLDGHIPGHETVQLLRQALVNIAT